MVTPSDEHRFFHVAIRLVLIAASIGTIMALFSRQHWFAELFSHFRMYYLLVLALLALIFLYTHHRILLTLTLLLVVPNAVSVGPYLAPSIIGKSEAAASGEPVSIVALNLNYRSDNFASALDYLAAKQADVVVVAEYTPAWEWALSVLDSEYPHRISASRVDPWGMAVFSKIPFSSAELLDLDIDGTVHARVVLDLDGSALEVFAAHLMVPVTRDSAEMRNRQLETLARIMSASEYPRILVGDLNITPFSPFFDEFLDDAGLVDARRPFGIHITWPTNAWPVWIPIDHCLADERVPVQSVSTGREFGSDHFPLEVMFRKPTRGQGMSQQPDHL